MIPFGGRARRRSSRWAAALAAGVTRTMATAVIVIERAGRSFTFRSRSRSPCPTWSLPPSRARSTTRSSAPTPSVHARRSSASAMGAARARDRARALWTSRGVVFRARGSPAAKSQTWWCDGRSAAPGWCHSRGRRQSSPGRGRSSALSAAISASAACSALFGSGASAAGASAVGSARLRGPGRPPQSASSRAPSKLSLASASPKPRVRVSVLLAVAREQALLERLGGAVGVLEILADRRPRLAVLRHGRARPRVGVAARRRRRDRFVGRLAPWWRAPHAASCGGGGRVFLCLPSWRRARGACPRGSRPRRRAAAAPRRLARGA